MFLGAVDVLSIRLGDSQHLAPGLIHVQRLFVVGIGRHGGGSFLFGS